MKNFVIILLGSVVILLQSCIKDKLKDDKSILIGKWNWSYTVHTSNICSPPLIEETITPSTENVNYSIEFLKKGKVKIYQNDKVIKKGRVAFSYWEESNTTVDGNYFIILLNNKTKNRIEGSISNDTLRLQRSFFFENDTDCYSEEDATQCCSNNCYYVKE